MEVEAAMRITRDRHRQRLNPSVTGNGSEASL